MITIRLNDLLKENGRTLYWLSKETGVRYATIWKISRGEVGRLGMDVLDQICAALACQPGDLLVRETKTKARKASSRKRGK